MPDDNTKITLEIDLKQANIVLVALAEQPWRIANDVIIAVRNQMVQQMQHQQPQNNVAQFTPGSVG
jgi:propanediol utilization protein